MVRPSALLIWLPWIRDGYDKRLRAAAMQDAATCEKWESGERERLRHLERARGEHEGARTAHIAKVDERNHEVDRFKAAYEAGDPEAIIAYSAMVLDRSEYPDCIEATFTLGFMEEARELVIQYQLPDVDCVPQFIEHKYVRSRDSIDGKARKAGDIRSTYREVIAAICLRSIHEVFEADRRRHLSSVVFTGLVANVDPATGRDAEFNLVSVRAKHDVFTGITLGRVDKIACLGQLGGRLSARPDEMQPIVAIAPYGSVEGLLELEEAPPAPRRRRAGGAG